MMDNLNRSYMVKLFKVLANDNRLKILELLSQAKFPLTVNAIAEKLQIEQGLLSSHMIRMRKDGVLTVRQEGGNMFYSIKDKNILSALNLVKWSLPLFFVSFNLGDSFI